MNLTWKEFQISIPVVEKWLKDNLASVYLGNMALPDGFIIQLSDSVTQIQLDSIISYWESLDEDSEAAQNYRGAQWFEDEILRLKTELTSKSWTKMNSIERKLVIGLEVTPLELLGI